MTVIRSLRAAIVVVIVAAVVIGPQTGGAATKAAFSIIAARGPQMNGSI
jgi:hypothetical protein